MTWMYDDFKGECQLFMTCKIWQVCVISISEVLCAGVCVYMCDSLYIGHCEVKYCQTQISHLVEDDL